MNRLTYRSDCSDCRENDIVFFNPNDEEGMYSILDLNPDEDKELLLQIAEKLADFEDEQEQREKEQDECKYCTDEYILDERFCNDNYCRYCGRDLRS